MNHQLIIMYSETSTIITGCGIPSLDENGLSNWTTGAGTVAFVCFPGYFLEGHDNVLVSECVNGTWAPGAPACVSYIFFIFFLGRTIYIIFNLTTEFSATPSGLRSEFSRNTWKYFHVANGC